MFTLRLQRLVWRLRRGITICHPAIYYRPSSHFWRSGTGCQDDRSRGAALEILAAAFDRGKQKKQAIVDAESPEELEGIEWS